jgi:ribokinase
MAVVASFGSVNIDHVVDAATAAPMVVDWFPSAGETVTVETVPEAVEAAASETHLGGKGANQAVAAARAEASATFYGMIGADAADLDVLDRLAERGVDVSDVVAADCPTGAAYILLEADGENRICVLPGANARVDEHYARRVAPKVVDADALLLQNEISVHAMVTVLDALPLGDEGPTVVLDPSPVAGVGPLLHHPAVDVVVPNGHESEVLADDLRTFKGTIVRTAGPEPVRVEPAEGSSYSVTPPKVDPVDATGAGDVLGGYLAAGLARGEAFQDALASAVTAASLSTEVPGAQSAPDLSTVRGRAARVRVH